MSKFKTILSWVCRITISVILIQTLRHKFVGSELSVYIFERIGIEPWGRYMAGVSELIVGILILIPRTVWVGSIGVLFIMGGALFFHITDLGIVVKEDGGTLFGMCLTVFTLSTITIYLHMNKSKA